MAQFGYGPDDPGFKSWRRQKIHLFFKTSKANATSYQYQIQQIIGLSPGV